MLRVVKSNKVIDDKLRNDFFSFSLSTKSGQLALASSFVCFVLCACGNVAVTPPQSSPVPFAVLSYSPAKKTQLKKTLFAAIMFWVAQKRQTI
jgi:hypothetical protein